jgi:nucleoside-diphosphate-sugar epimerase
VHGWVSESARRLAASALGADRVLVTGASGWLGRTALDLIAPLGLPTLALASRSRMIRVSGRDVECRTWDDREVSAFGPTVVLDCAFLTKGFATTMPLADYVATNRLLTERLLYATRLPQVRLALTVSSGAAVHPHDAYSGALEDNPYGYLKREAEQRLMEAAADTGAVPVVARAWSISGAHVQDPQNFALGSMIRAAAEGSIRITANRPVFRRYVLAEELLAVGIAEGAIGATTVDSGGELVEMNDLAHRIAAVVNPGAHISRAGMEAVNPDRYHSDGCDWDDHCRRLHFVGASLEEQIEITARGVLS